MGGYRHLLIRRVGPVEHVVLDRPDVRNAFNEALIEDLHAWATTRATGGDEVRVAVLSGAGRVFCAGGDLAWMAETVDVTREENLRSARRMAAMFEALDVVPVPLIGRIHGAAVGGGAGLAAVCDIVIATPDTQFGFTEVKLGLVPAVISPYALAKIGRSAARELFLTGARFSAARAREIGLVHDIVPQDALDGAVDRYVREVLTAEPAAVATAKEMIRRVWAGTPPDVLQITTDAIASRRVSPAGQEGMRAFLEKRPARWVSTTRPQEGGGE
ncbi:MAG TPA: enoyl-CoA hydratase-related protein [Vicinamibacterales bacterium]|jgi:methylglutaconyl-CoA hydratase